MDFRIELM